MSDWERDNELLADALDTPLEERDAFLRRACAGDEPLRRRVEALLELESGAAAFLGATTDGPGAVAQARVNGEEPADVERTIGRYRTLRVLGTGGMGTVYEAQQDRPHRMVALKVLQRGMTSPQAMTRFEREVEVLGRLHHVNIAQVYDAGTFDDGHGPLPYFAMELIHGRSLLGHCEHERLGTDERLALFVKICDGVEYAHQRGVIHRDLKPDNVLVDDTGEPKILDFGVARITGSDVRATTLRTDMGQLVGTVPYMSPEQVTGDPAAIDARSDVYALGVVLYELMCGRLPYDLRGHTVPEAVRAIQEDEPTPLSSFDRTLRGDVETIVARALEKEKDRRYQSAAQLAADVRHYLAEEPIVARPASTLYQLRKFVRRNRGFASAVVVAFAALAVGAGVASWQAVQAHRKAREAEAVTQWLEQMIAAASPLEQGPETKLLTLLDDWAGTIEEQFAAQPLVVARLRHALAEAYRGLGTAEQAEQAESHARRALELRADELGAEHVDTLSSKVLLANIYELQGRYDEAEATAKQALATCERVFGAVHPLSLEAKSSLAWALMRQNHFDEAEALFVEVLELHRSRGEPDHETMVAWRSLGMLYMYTARFDRTHFDEAERHLLEAIEIGGRLYGDEDPRVLACWTNLATNYRVQDEPDKVDKAEEILTRTHASQERVLGPDHRVTLETRGTLADVYRRQGRLEEAERVSLESLEALTLALGPRRPGTLGQHLTMGTIYEDLGRYREAEARYLHVLDVGREEFGPLQTYAVFAMEKLARLYARAAEECDRDPETVFREALAAAIAWVDANPGEFDATSAMELNTLAWWIVRDAGFGTESHELALSAVTRCVAANTDDPIGAIANTLGVAQYRTGRYAEALATLTDRDRRAREAGLPAAPEDWAFIAMAHHRLGHADQARAALEQLRELMAGEEAGGERGAFAAEAEALVSSGS